MVFSDALNVNGLLAPKARQWVSSAKVITRNTLSTRITLKDESKNCRVFCVFCVVRVKKLALETRFGAYAKY